MVYIAKEMQIKGFANERFSIERFLTFVTYYDTKPKDFANERFYTKSFCK